MGSQPSRSPTQTGLRQVQMIRRSMFFAWVFCTEFSMHSSQVIVLGLLAAASVAVSPAFAAPVNTPAVHSRNVDNPGLLPSHFLTRHIPRALDNSPTSPPIPESDSYKGKRAYDINILQGNRHLTKRAGDSATAGGNAYTGSASNADGGSVDNHASSDGEINNDGGSKCYGTCAEMMS